MTTTKRSTLEELAAASNTVADEAGGRDIEELMRDAELEIEPGDKPGTIINKPSADAPMGVMLSDIESAGWVRVWDVRTREMSLVNRNMLRAQLQKRDPETGKLVFTTQAPKTPPERGSLVCPLNKDSAERPTMDAFGFAFCPKKNLRSPLDVRTHMQHRHKREWEAIQEDRRLATEAEERQVRQAIINRSSSPVEYAEPRARRGRPAKKETA